jgi:TP901 family phage tail tape measure protein
MADFANLVLGVDTSGLKRGERALNDTTRAAGAAEGKVRNASGQFVKAGNAAAAAAPKVGLLNNSTSALSVSMASLRRQAGLAIAAYAGFSTVISAVRIVADFETSISRLGAVSRATNGELEALRDIAKDLGSTTEFSASQAADGLNFLAMAGFNATEAMAAIPSVLDLATASGMGLAEAADTASNIMSGFGISAANAAEVADVLAAASTRANTTVGQLGAAMSTVAPIASALDMSLEDTAAAIGVLSDAGIQGERAGTGLRGVLAALAGPTSEAEKVLRGLGLTLSDVDPAANDLSVVMARLGAAGLSTADAMTLFGREAASGALVLIDGAQRVGDFGDELERANGAAQTMAETMRDNLGGDLKGAMSAAQGLAIALGDAGLTAIIRGTVQAVTGLVRGLTTVAENAKILGVVIMSLAATQIPAAIAAFALYSGGMSAAGIATAAFTLATKAARLALIAFGGPLGIVYGLLGAAAGAFFLFRDNAGEMEVAAYDAEAGSLALAKALGEVTSAEPASSAAVIALANNNVALADSAYEAARAELAKRRAMLGELVTAGGGGRRRRLDTSAAQRAVIAANEALTASEEALSIAIQERLITSEDIAMFMPVVAANTDGMTDATASATEAAAALAAELDKLTGSSGGASGAVEQLADDLTDAELAAIAAAEAFDDKLTSAVDSVADAFGNWIASGFQDFKGMMDNIIGSFKSMISQLIATAIANPIKIALGIGGGGAAGMASQAMGGSGIIGSALGGLGSLSGGIASGASVAFNGLMAGGGLGPTMGAISGGFGAGGLAGIGTAIGAAALPLAAVFAVVSFFKSKTKTIDSGIRATIDMEDAMFESFKEIEKSRFFGLSKKRSTSFNTLAGDDSAPLDAAVFAVRESVIGATESLRVSIDVFNGFTHDFTLSLKGLDEAARTAAISEEFARMGDSMAGLVPNIASMNQLFAVAANRVGLMDRLLQAQGNTEELTARIREREMDATNELNKSLLAQVFAAEDAAAAVNKLTASFSENAFATGVDFRRGLSRAANGIETTPQQSQAEMLAELKALNARIDVLQSTSEITANSSSQTAENTDYSNALTLDAAT